MDEAFFLGIIFFFPSRVLSQPQLVLKARVLPHKARERGEPSWESESFSDDATPEQCQRWRVSPSDNVLRDLGVRGRVSLAPRLWAPGLWAVGTRWQRGSGMSRNKSPCLLWWNINCCSTARMSEFHLIFWKTSKCVTVVMNRGTFKSVFVK